MTDLMVIETVDEFALESYVETKNESEIAAKGRPWSYFYAAKQFLSAIEDTGEGLLDGLRSYVDRLRSEGLPANTFNHRISAAKHLIRHAIRSRSGDISIADKAGLLELLGDIKLAKIDPGMQAVTESKYLDLNELRSFISRCEDKTIALMCEFMARTGARISEMLDVRVGDVVCSKGHCLVRLHGKGNKEREAVVGQEFIDTIRDQFTGATWLFEHSGRRYNRTSVAARVSKAGESILHRRVHPHAFRHSYGTLKYEETHDIVGVQRAMGHASVSTTEALYVHHSLPENQRELKFG